MKTKSYSYRSSSDLCTIRAWQWYPDDGEVKAVIQMHHGMAEHSGRYINWITDFVSRGYAVFMNDMINHGKSNDIYEELGYFGEKDGFKYIVKDAKLLTDIAKKEYPDKKFIIAGHSMGSMVMRSYVSYCGSDFDGAAFIGTAGSNPAAKPGLAVIAMISKFKGSKYKSNLLDSLVTGPYNKPFEGRTTYDWGMRDTAQVDEYMADKYCGYKFTAVGYRDLVNLMCDCNNAKFFESVPKDKAVLLMSGSMDPVGNYKKGVKEVYHKLLDTGHTNVSLKFFEDARHEILNETNKEEVYDYFNNWIEENIL